MDVIIHLIDQAQPIVYENVQNAYVKAGMYCICLTEHIVHKFPIDHVWRLVEKYEPHDRGHSSV